MTKTLITLGFISLHLLAEEPQEADTNTKFISCLQRVIERAKLTETFQSFLGSSDVTPEAITQKLGKCELTLTSYNFVDILELFGNHNTAVRQFNLERDFLVEVASFGAPTIPLVVSNDGLFPS